MSLFLKLFQKDNDDLKEQLNECRKLSDIDNEKMQNKLERYDEQFTKLNFYLHLCEFFPFKNMDSDRLLAS